MKIITSLSSARNNGQRHGKGEYIFANGDLYVGEWNNGQKHGEGKFIYANGCYIGQSKNGQRHGKGEYIFANGDLYVGEWNNGQKHGKGQYISANGDRYVGEWRDDKMDGYCRYENKTGVTVIEGYWKDDLLYERSKGDQLHERSNEIKSRIIESEISRQINPAGSYCYG